MDSANRRYGFAPGRARANQACTSGLVAESRRYGSPTAAPSSSRMALTGSSSPSGFQLSAGAIGSVAAAAASSAMCRIAWLRGASFALEACA